ncbi:MAG: hypothetical protein AB7O37_12285 [Vicinamibacteria bacterium]
MKTTLIRAFALGVLLGGLPAAAQDPEPMDGPQDRRQRGARPDRPREEVIKLIDAYVISNVQESLLLSDEQFVKLLPLLKRLQTERRSANERRFRILMELRRSLAGGAATEAAVAERMKELRALEAEEPGRLQGLQAQMQAIDALLTPLQQAKFRIFELEVERRIRELISARRPAQSQGRNRPEREP